MNLSKVTAAFLKVKLGQGKWGSQGTAGWARSVHLAAGRCVPGTQPEDSFVCQPPWVSPVKHRP